MMRLLVLLHRWLGVAFCLLFAMWFATGIVMHFVPFPSLSEADRVAGLMPVDPAGLRHDPATAVVASGLKDIMRVRLIGRPEGAVYLLSGPSGVQALRDADLASAAITSPQTALEIAVDHARRRGLDVSKAAVAERADYDQWTVPNRFDPYRPLYRVALNDAEGTDIYVSSVTGEVLLQSRRAERLWNYAGSVVHWIYPTALRSNWAAWDKTVWWLSLAALIAAVSGACLGTLRIRKAFHRLLAPRKGWYAWHHILGLACMTFVLTWSLSGWLSMDHGRLFSRGMLTAAQAAVVDAVPAWDQVHLASLAGVVPAREIEWFAFDRRVYVRARTDVSAQSVREADESSVAALQPTLSVQAIAGLVKQFAPDCATPQPIESGDAFFVASVMPGVPVFRVVCGDVWFHIDGANGAVLERIDGSRRAYRWIYSGLHTLDFPLLLAHPLWRSVLVVGLCGLGFIFSITGVVLGWRRLRFWLQSQQQGASAR